MGDNSPTGIRLPETDKDGNNRVINGIVDIGAFEYLANGMGPRAH
jgi:hypothetical protein